MSPVRHLVARAAVLFNVGEREILSPSRRRAVNQARFAVMTVAAGEMGLTTKQIAAVMDRERSSVSAALGSARRLATGDFVFAQLLERLRAAVPTMEEERPAIVTETLHDGFTKYHLNRHGEQPWPFRPVLHRFTTPDEGDPHDHPWAFQSFILRGSYVEEVFVPRGDGTYAREVRHHRSGTVVDVPAEHIHRIIQLPEGECWTMALYGALERDVHFWRFDKAGRGRSRHYRDADFAVDADRLSTLG